MWSWNRLFGASSRPSAPSATVAAPAPPVLAPPAVRPAASGSPLSAPIDPATRIPTRLIEFLDAWTSATEPMAAEDLSAHDVLFLEGLIRRLEAAKLEMAMLPEATLRLTEMLRHGDVPITQYVMLINQDASLSVEVLKAANSAFYAHTARTSSLHEAIMRIGLTRLQSILMLTLLKSRVLKAGSLRAHAELLIDMSLPLASLASAVARASGGPQDLCFMRGMLMHVEHLLVLGTIGDTSREHRAVITPSTGALLLAFARSGSDVRHSLAYGWGLEDILLSRPDDGDPVDYAALRLALVARWLRRPLPPIENVPIDQFERVMRHVAPRVPEAAPQEDAMPEKASA